MRVSSLRSSAPHGDGQLHTRSLHLTLLFGVSASAMDKVGGPDVGKSTGKFLNGKGLGWVGSAIGGFVASAGSLTAVSPTMIARPHGIKPYVLTPTFASGGVSLSLGWLGGALKAALGGSFATSVSMNFAIMGYGIGGETQDTSSDVGAGATLPDAGVSLQTGVTISLTPFSWIEQPTPPA